MLGFIDDVCSEEVYFDWLEFFLFEEVMLENIVLMLCVVGDLVCLCLFLWFVDGECCVFELVEVEGEKFVMIFVWLKLLYFVWLVMWRCEVKYVYYVFMDEYIVSFVWDIFEYVVEEIIVS